MIAATGPSTRLGPLTATNNTTIVTNAASTAISSNLSCRHERRWRPSPAQTEQSLRSVDSAGIPAHVVRPNQLWSG